MTKKPYLVTFISNAPVAPGLETQTRLNTIETNSAGMTPKVIPKLKNVNDRETSKVVPEISH